MEPESHRLDREAMLAEHEGVAERVSREVDETVAAAAEKRRAYLDGFVQGVRVEVRAQLERRLLLEGTAAASSSGPAADPELEPFPSSPAAVREG
jgi:hypothetical protein